MENNFKMLLCMYLLITILNFLYLFFKKTYKKKMFWLIWIINLCPALHFLVTIAILMTDDKKQQN